MQIIINDTIKGRKELITHYETALQCPEWANNDSWDAFRDVLLRLPWSDDDFSVVEIIHESLPQLSKNEMLIYLEILIECEDMWARESEIGPNVDFTVRFSKECDIESYVKALNRREEYRKFMDKTVVEVNGRHIFHVIALSILFVTFVALLVNCLV